jgi:hypothetical protein
VRKLGIDITFNEGWYRWKHYAVFSAEHGLELKEVVNQRHEDELKKARDESKSNNTAEEILNKTLKG